MSPRTWLDRIGDMLSCAKNIRDFSSGMTLHEFLGDPRTIRAVAFEFTTIGEAARVIPTENQKLYPGIPWGKIQGIRNVLVHEYFRLDEEILWKSVQEDIPPLIAALEKIIETEKK